MEGKIESIIKLPYGKKTLYHHENGTAETSLKLSYWTQQQKLLNGFFGNRVLLLFLFQFVAQIHRRAFEFGIPLVSHIG